MEGKARETCRSGHYCRLSGCPCYDWHPKPDTDPASQHAWDVQGHSIYDANGHLVLDNLDEKMAQQVVEDHNARWVPTAKLADAKPAEERTCETCDDQFQMPNVCWKCTLRHRRCDDVDMWHPKSDARNPTVYPMCKTCGWYDPLAVHECVACANGSRWIPKPDAKPAEERTCDTCGIKGGECSVADPTKPPVGRPCWQPKESTP